jgi:hypothetical protein
VGLFRVRQVAEMGELHEKEAYALEGALAVQIRKAKGER